MGPIHNLMTAQLGAESVKYQGPSLEGRALSLNRQVQSLNRQAQRLNRQAQRLNCQALTLNSGSLNSDFHTFGFESRALRVERRARRLEHEAFCIKRGPRRLEKNTIFASVASRFVQIGAYGRIALLRWLLFDIWSIEFEGQRVVVGGLSLGLRGLRLVLLFHPLPGAGLGGLLLFHPLPGATHFLCLAKESKQRKARPRWRKIP